MKRDPLRWLLAAGLTGLGLSAPFTHAQNAPAEPAPFVAPTYSPHWSSPAIESIASQLAGDWQTTAPVAELGGEGSAHFTMHIAPAPIDGMSDTLYVESARADEQNKPFRQAIFHLFEYKGSVRLRTLELAIPADAKGVLTGLWAAPEWFPLIEAGSLIATIDIDMTKQGDGGWKGASPYPYPTSFGGAVEMTSSFEVSPGRLVTRDTGFAADGSIAWGADGSAAYTFEKSPDGAKVDKRDNGLVIIDFVNPGNMVVGEKDRLHIHYNGYLDNMTMFDSSIKRGQPFVFAYPVTNTVAGWAMGMEKISVGTQRKLIIPGYLGYGDRGNPSARIPPDATLFFDVNCIHIDKYEPDPEPVSEPAGEHPAGGEHPTDDPHAGHDHD